MLTSVFTPNRIFWFICACVFVYMYIAIGGEVGGGGGGGGGGVRGNTDHLTD